jgi:hypothetical protein
MQSSVTNSLQATGIIGEFSREGGKRANGVILNSDTESNNIVGRVVHFVDGNDYEVGVAADGNLAGVLCCPKNSYRVGLGAVPYLPNTSQSEVAEEGYMFVLMAGAADKGDWVYFSDTTGEILTAAPGVVPTAGYSRLPGGYVTKNVSGAGVGEIYFDLAGSNELPTA